MTKKFKPLLAENADIETLRFPVIASAKIDGIRCLMHPELGAVSRKLKPIPNRHIRGRLNDAGAVWFDGEIVTYTDGKIDDFNTIQSRVMSEDGAPEFALLAFDHFLQADAPYRLRLSYMHEVSSILISDIFRIHDSVEIQTMEELMQYEQTCVDQGWEGIMTRDPGGRYKFGRSTARDQILLKIKRFQDDEAEIIGFVEQLHNANEATTDELGHTKRSSAKQGLVAAQKLGAFVLKWRNIEFEIGTGFTDFDRTEYWQHRDKLVGKLATFKYQGVGSQGRPRFPVFKGLRNEIDVAA